MSWLNTKNYLGLIAALSAVFFVSNAQAATLYGQVSDSSTQSSNIGHVISGGKYPEGQQIGTGLSGTIATTTIYLSTGSGSGSTTAGVKIECYDDSAYTTLNAGCSSSNPTQVIGQNSSKTSYSFSTALTLNPAKYYRLGIGCNANCSGGTNPDTYTYGATQNLYTRGAFSTGFGIADAYFQLAGNITQGIAITFPTATTTADFATTLLRTNFTAGTYDVYVEYATTTGNLAATSTAYFTDHRQMTIGQDVQEWNFGVPKSQPLQVGGTFSLYAFMQQNGSTIATSSQITLTITSDQAYTIDEQIAYLANLQNPPNSTSSDLTITCDPDDPVFQRSMCNLAMFLFIPSQASMNAFTTLKDDLSVKPPFGYVSAISTVLASSSLANGTSSATFGAAAQFPILSTVNTTISLMLYLALGFYIFNRARKFEL